MEQVRDRLTRALDPVELEVEDDSHLHVGHPGARDGRRHLRVRIRAHAFRGVRALDRHRMVYVALGDLMQTDIHALAIDAEPTADAFSEIKE